MTIRYDKKGKYFTPIETKDPVPAIIQTDRHRIHGTLHIHRNQRIIDVLNKTADFIAVTDADVYDSAGNIVHQPDFIMVHQAHIVWVMPDDEPLPDDDPVEDGS